MPALLLNNFCGCIELKTGSFILGYLNQIVSLILIIITAIELGSGVKVNMPGMQHAIGSNGFNATSMSIFLIINLLCFLFGTILLVGLHKNKPGHVKVYLIFAVISLVPSVVNSIIVCATGAKPIAISVISILISIPLSIYFILVIRSTYYQMKDPSAGAVLNVA